MRPRWSPKFGTSIRVDGSVHLFDRVLGGQYTMFCGHRIDSNDRAIRRLIVELHTTCLGCIAEEGGTPVA